jgi:peptide/nickel transport system permease protein
MIAKTTTPNFFAAVLSASKGRGLSTLRALGNGLRLTLRTKAGRVGLSLIVLHLVLAFLGPWLAPYSATEFHLDYQLEPPSSQFWLGTDQFGRDILSRVMCGAGSIIAISLTGTALGIALGTLVGLSSAYIGGTVDDIIMRAMDGLMSFPSLLLALLVLTMVPKPEEWLPPFLAWDGLNIVMTIGICFMPFVARVIRSATLPLKTAEFVQNARLRGEGVLYIMFVEILPNIVPVLMVEVSVRAGYAILLASSLGFLGLGVQPPSSDWGLMISESRRFIVNAPWVALAPAGAISSLVVGVNLLSDGIRQARRLPKGKLEA